MQNKIEHKLNNMINKIKLNNEFNEKIIDDIMKLNDESYKKTISYIHKSMNNLYDMIELNNEFYGKTINHLHNIEEILEENQSCNSDNMEISGHISIDNIPEMVI